ncbi:MAG: hypothetical protein KTR17_11105 [Cellvibrionaceae bacterium]|nr:hypothetical protein [Cellvibrionaceae bacterium]
MTQLPKGLIQKHMFPAFVTPIVNYVWPEHEKINTQLYEMLKNQAECERGLARSNVGGWHSSLDFFDCDDELVQELKKKIQAFTQELLAEFYPPDALPSFRMEAWANVLGFGAYNTVHTHPNAAWSGIYYVTANEAVAEHSFSGKLELIDPRVAANFTYADQSSLYGRFLLSPVAGQMIMFPAWLQHQVHPYFGKGLRVSIAVNIIL